MANTIPVHEDKVSGPNTALTIDALTMNVFGVSGEMRMPEQQEQRQRAQGLPETRHCALAKQREILTERQKFL